MLSNIKIKNGRIIPNDLISFKKALENFEGKENIELIIRKKRKHCTSNQRKYYFKIIVSLISGCTGYEKKETHYLLREMFLGYNEKDNLISTEDLNTVEKEEYHSEIRRWASKELNCYIPEPNEVNY